VLDFLARRIAISILTFLLITLIVFTGVRMIPGDPARVMAGTDADEAGLQEIRARYGLTDPILWFPIIRNASFTGKTNRPVVRKNSLRHVSGGVQSWSILPYLAMCLKKPRYSEDQSGQRCQ